MTVEINSTMKIKILCLLHNKNNFVNDERAIYKNTKIIINNII